MWFFLILFTILVIYVVLDVHYFVRTAATILFARYFRKKINILEPSAIYGKNFFNSEGPALNSVHTQMLN